MAPLNLQIFKTFTKPRQKFNDSISRLAYKMAQLTYTSTIQTYKQIYRAPLYL